RRGPAGVGSVDYAPGGGRARRRGGADAHQAAPPPALFRLARALGDAPHALLGPAHHGVSRQQDDARAGAWTARSCTINPRPTVTKETPAHAWSGPLHPTTRPLAHRLLRRRAPPRVGRQGARQSPGRGAAPGCGAPAQAPARPEGARRAPRAGRSAANRRGSARAPATRPTGET